MIDSIKTNLERLTVTAPIDGKILRVNVRPGEYAQVGVLRDGLMIIGDVSTMHVRVEVDETDALRVKPAAEVYGTLRGSTTEQIGLKFVRKEPLLSPKKTLTGDGNERVDTRVQQLIYSFDNGKAGAFVGQQMDVFIDAK
jgi:multidrug efflux pump subunit AcrA (membrane-fusion protein)